MTADNAQTPMASETWTKAEPNTLMERVIRSCNVRCSSCRRRANVRLESASRSATSSSDGQLGASALISCRTRVVTLPAILSAPRVAWPTLLLPVYIAGGVVTVDYATTTGLIPLWVGMLLNILAMWPVFHVSLEVFRYSRMLHHRFTNDAQAPDHYVHGHRWTLQLRWCTFDLYYGWTTFRRQDPRGRKALRQTLPFLAATLLVAGALCLQGHGLDVLMLWLIPSHLTLALIAFTFLWLPHLDGDEHGKLIHITSAESSHTNLTAGTTLRLGYEGLLDPLMQWHNYHPIHHLWPTTPSYNHRVVWRLMEAELRSRDLRIQHGFALIPTFHAAGSTAPAAH